MELGNVARGLRRIRIERGWQQHDMAVRLGVSPTKVSRLETGVRRVRKADEVARIAAQLGVEAGDPDC